MISDINKYNSKQRGEDKKICNELFRIIKGYLKGGEGKVWHAHPVWFLDGNPVAGYSKLKAGLQLMFWSGRSFDEPILIGGKGRFKDASIMYTKVTEIKEKEIKRWLKKATFIQWDYKNIVKRRGKLIRLESK